MAYVNIREIKAMQTKRATVDYISSLSWDNDYIVARQKFLNLKNRHVKFEKIATDYEKFKARPVGSKNQKLTAAQLKLSEEHSSIMVMLNEYESMAVAVNNGVYNTKILQDNMKQRVLTDLRACGPFIRVTREESSKDGYDDPEALYKECCGLYKEWSGRPLEVQS
jgi:hypothetical protein